MSTSKPSAPDFADAALGRRARDSVLWNTGLIAAINVGQIALTLVLVRLLTPEIYGQFGLLMAISGFVVVFSGQAFFEHIVQARPGEEPNVQDAFTAACALNACLFVALNALAVGLGALADYSPLQIPLHLLSVGLLLQPVRALRFAMLKRELDWRRIRVLHAVGFVLSAIVSVTIAWLGGGIHALVASTLLVPLPYIYDLIVTHGWRPSWAWDSGRFRPAMLFGVNRQLSAALSSSRSLLESTLMVQSLGFASYGVYGRAVGIGGMILGRIVGHSVDAVYPVLTRIDRNSERMRRANALTLRALAWMAIPATAAVSMLAEPIVDILFGRQWTEVVPLVGWAMLSVCIASLTGILYRFMLANEEARRCLTVDLATCAGGVLALVVLLPHGLIAYLQGLALVNTVALVLAATWLCRAGGLAPVDLGATLLAPLPATGAAWTICHYAEALVPAGLGMLAGCLLSAGLFLGVYAILMRIALPRQVDELVAYLPRPRVLRRMLMLA